MEGKAAQIDQNTADISLVKSHLEAVEIVDTASGAIASFADGSDGVPVESLTVSMEPIQNLHGQDAPYPAGGGKNLLEVTATSQTLNGVTFTVHDDGTVMANGTATVTVFFELIASSISFTESTILNGCPSGGGGNTYAIQLNGTVPLEVGSGITIAADTTITSVRIRVASGTTLNNVVFKPMIRLASVSDSTFAPYSNICPISGRQSVTVWRTGVNVFDGVWELGSIDHNTGNERAVTNTIRTGFVPVKGGRDYTLSWVSSQSLYIMLIGYKADKTYLRYLGARTLTPTKITLDEDVAYIRWITYDNTVEPTNMQLELGSTATAYEAPQIQSVQIPLGQTVYGGTVDVVSGEMVVDRAMVDMGTLNWSKATNDKFYTVLSAMKRPGVLICSVYPQSTIARLENVPDKHIWNQGYAFSVYNVVVVDSSYTDSASFKAAMSGVQLCYELEQPITITLTPEQLTTVLGTNNVWSDADSVSVDYVADTKKYIAKVIAAALA